MVMTPIKPLEAVILCGWATAGLLLAYSRPSTDPLTTAEDFWLLDKRITRRVGTARRETWDEMVDDIVFFTHSLVNLQWTLEQNSTGLLSMAEELASGGKPSFIDRPLNKRANRQVNLTEWDFYRFISLRTDAGFQWQRFTSLVNDLKFNQTNLIEV